MCAFSYYTMFEVLCILEQQMVAANLYTVISCTRIGSSPAVGEGYLWVVPINHRRRSRSGWSGFNRTIF